MPFVSKLFPKWHCKQLLRTDPLKALVIGGFVRGLSMRDIESLCEEAGLGKTWCSTVATLCAELHERFEAFCRRSLYDVNLVVLFQDAIYPPVRPSGPKEGAICAWGITENGARALVSVRLGTREAKEDWLEFGRDLTSRGLAAPRLVVADGAPGLISAVGEIWPRADRQALRRSPPAQPPGQAPEVRARTDPPSTTGQRSPTRPRNRSSSQRREPCPLLSRQLDAAGRRRSPATTPAARAGIAPRNKGQTYQADPPQRASRRRGLVHSSSPSGRV